MNTKNKNIILTIVIVLIIGVISYLELRKPAYNSNTPDVSIPSYVLNVTSSSSSSAVLTATSSSQTFLSYAQKSAMYPRAKELVDPTGFINTEPFKLSDFVGKKVILVDFWTYSCINCQRTIPYLNAWYQKYKDEGLVIVGVHTPEFDFEKNYDNVAAAVKQLGIQYPVVLDSNQGTWNAYQNLYWPEEYLIDTDGFVVHTQIGEGDYSGTEKAIQQALLERNHILGLNTPIDMSISSPKDVVTVDSSQLGSPEMYFGAERNEYLANGTQGALGAQSFTIPSSLALSALPLNELYLGGMWNIQDQYAENTTGGATITLHYLAKNVYMVASSASGVQATILLDGKPLGSQAGSDVAPDSTISIHNNRLYNLVSGSNYGEHVIEIKITNPGLDAFTFTFG